MNNKLVARELVNIAKSLTSFKNSDEQFTKRFNAFEEDFRMLQAGMLYLEQDLKESGHDEMATEIHKQEVHLTAAYEQYVKVAIAWEEKIEKSKQTKVDEKPA